MKIVGFISLCLIAAAGHATAQPVAMVLGVQGTVNPPVAPYAELEPGATLTLAPGAVLTINHYGSCNEVTVHGGTVTVGDDTLDLTDATGIARQPATCPRVISPAVVSVGAGVILRGGAFSVLPGIALMPEIVIAGDAGAVRKLRIGHDGREIADLPVRAGRVIWPTTLALSDGEDYVLVLRDGDVFYRVGVVADRNALGRVILRLSPAE